MGEFGNKEYASKGVAGAGLGTGIAGLALGVLNSAGMLGGGGRGLFGWGNGCGCGDGYGYGGASGRRWDIEVSEALAQRDAEISRLQAKAYSDESDLAIYKYFDGQLKDVRERLCKQEVFNEKMMGTIRVISEQVTDLDNLTKSITRTAIPESAICDFGGRGCNTCTVTNT